ncbi:MAG: DNA gyrase inhibitor YacG [Methylophilus sp.]|uniref:DNA gyrase inhibitor YacG n=1 Tax=Methylophilus sp. TaxID=29541 RepID=UPI002C7C6254|nr:DNA gyrase inhibitor YacG [Methylophilus sp.]HSH88093.1 DNA gyrase inhibitor YacG [Methylophilus sp.]
MQAAAKPRKVACPGCGEMTEYSPTNAYRPFCSERCKLMDLGDWATEKFRIPDTTPPDLDETE